MWWPREWGERANGTEERRSTGMRRESQWKWGERANGNEERGPREMRREGQGNEERGPREWGSLSNFKCHAKRAALVESDVRPIPIFEFDETFKIWFVWKVLEVGIRELAFLCCSDFLILTSWFDLRTGKDLLSRCNAGVLLC